MPKLSPALLLASQLAEYEAVKSRQDHVEPEHLMIAVLSLDKVFDPAVQWQFQIPEATVAEVRAEWEPARAALAGQGAEPSTIRRSLRKSLERLSSSASDKMAFPDASPATSQVLARAGSIAMAMASDRVRIEHFVIAFLGEPIPRLQELVRALNLNPIAIRSALIPLKRTSDRPTPHNPPMPEPGDRHAPQPSAVTPQVPPAAAQSPAVTPQAPPVPAQAPRVAAQPPVVTAQPAPAAPPVPSSEPRVSTPTSAPPPATAAHPVADHGHPAGVPTPTLVSTPKSVADMPQTSASVAVAPPLPKTDAPHPPSTVADRKEVAKPLESTEMEVALARTQVIKSADATRAQKSVVQSVKGSAQRLACLLELPSHVEKQTRLEPFLQHFLRGVMDAMPAAQRGAILMRGSGEDDFLLKAHHPIGEPAVNMAAARQAMQTKQAFISRSHDGHAPQSDAAYGVYAPLVWKGEILGVLCIDGAAGESSFDSDDLSLVMNFAQHASMSIVNFRLQDEARRGSALIERLLTNFSPKIRQRLLERARRGRLQLGGERSEVTILFSDIRNFTNITADLETEDVLDMLNECFSASAESIFKFGGTIDKFVGDSVLAVFGSPDPDPQQHINALRAALSMQQAMAQLNRDRSARGRALCQIGIGVHCGEVLHGFVGAAERIEFTVIGDAVNRAARYCAAAAAGDVLISSELYQRVWRTVEASQTTIPTKHEGPLTAYRIKGLRDEPSTKVRSA